MTPRNAKPAPARGRPKTSDAANSSRRGPLAWVLGWVGIPALVLGGTFLSGVLVGAHFPDLWVTRAFVWLGRAFE